MTQKQWMDNQNYSNLMSILEDTKKQITKLQINVQASIDLKSLSHKELINKINEMIKNHEEEENRDEYICCILLAMTGKSELNWQLFWKTKQWENFLSEEEEKILSSIDGGRTQYLTEHITDPKNEKEIKNLLSKLLKAYKEMSA